MWTAEQRRGHERPGLRYPSDLTDTEWALVESFIPPAKRGGRQRTVDVREVLNGILYVLASGCQWRALPKDLPPRSTVHDYLTLWTWNGMLGRLHHVLFVQARERAGKVWARSDQGPTVAIVDSQSVKSAEKGACALIHRDTMQARRSLPTRPGGSVALRGPDRRLRPRWARSGTSWSTRSASC